LLFRQLLTFAVALCFQQFAQQTPPGQAAELVTVVEQRLRGLAQRCVS
jgi:hypothetical protein